MSDRERAIARLMEEHAMLLRRADFRPGPAILRSMIERAYDAGAAAVALDLGKQTGAALIERDRLLAEAATFRQEADRALALERSLEAGARRIHQLEQALRKYGGHDLGCTAFDSCNCGLDAVLGTAGGEG